MKDNITFTKCFWCGEDMGREDSEAPHYVIMSYEPCNKCKKAFKKGILLAGVSKEPIIENMPPISESNNIKLYPTGVHAVITEDFAKFVFNKLPQEQIDSILKSRKVLMPSEFIVRLLETLDKINEEENK